jgi:hypothetical protein
MGLGERRSTTSCFCSSGCPPGTFPFRQYWIIAAAIAGPDTGGEHWLFRFASAPTPDLCTWDPVESHGIIPIIAELRLNVQFGPGGPQGYQFELTMSQGLLFSFWSQIWNNAPPAGGLVQPEADNSCSRIRIVLPFALPVSGFEAVMTPAYPDACVDVDWPAKEQRKPLAAF